MALIIEGGITIGGYITITAENINPTANLVVFYDAGNSMSYSGSGISFSTDYTGPNLNTYEQYGVLDLAGLTGGPWNSGVFVTSGDNVTWTSQGVASYWSLIGDSQQYLDSTYQQESPTLNSPTYTIVSVVRPQDFAAGAIVGGDETTFAFVPNGGLDDGPSLVAGNSYAGPSVVDSTTAFELDTWYCVAVTYDAGSDTMKLYTNGNLVSTATGVGSPTHPTGLYWGTLEGDLWYTGDMAVCMAYERVLGAGEISQLSDVYLSRYLEPAQTSSALFTYPYLGGPPTSFTVPEGVYSISAVAVGGGGGGTADEYAVPGGDTVMLRTDSSVYVQTTLTGTTNTIVVDPTTYPAIANVVTGNSWIVGGADIPGPANGIPAWDSVVSVNSDDPGNTVITIDKSINTTAGDNFFFYQAVVAAEGGYEIPTYFYNQANQNPSAESPNGPGARALPLVTDGPYGDGGVVDWTTGYPIGGGVSLYGRYTSGPAGTFVDANTDPAGIALGGGGGSNPFTDTSPGGQATPWNGGRGGWPGGAGASATGYWVGGNGGALAYRNNYAVTPGEQYTVLVGVGGQGQHDGGSGAHGAIRIVWPGDTRTFPSTNVAPDTVAVPTLAITDHNFPNFSTTGTLDWSITSDGGSDVLETGVVWGLSGQDTYLDSTDVCDGSSSTAQRKAIRADNDCGNAPTTGLTGAQTLNFNVYQFDNEEIQVRAYARNEAGVAYSPTTLTWTPVICLAEGTLITLADGTTKTIETVAMTDSLKVWDFDNSVATSALPLWIKQKESTIQYNLIRFSDGSELKTIGQHRIFNKQKGMFTYPMTDDTPIGTITVKSDGTEITVTSKQVVYESVNYYNVITSGGYLNMYANDILTSMRYNNIYPITDMQYVKDSRVLRNRSEFAGIADRWIDGLRLPEQTIDIKRIRKYVDRLEKNEKTQPTTGRIPSWQ